MYNLFYWNQHSTFEKRNTIILFKPLRKITKFQRHFDSYSEQFRVHVSNSGQSQNEVYFLQIRIHITPFLVFIYFLLKTPK